MTQFSPDEAFRALQRLARAQANSRTDQLLDLYLHERFLARLSVSRYRDNLILKGGMLLAAFDVRRPTRDADLLALRLSNDEETVARIVAEIASIKMQDGVVFETTAAKLEVIRDDEGYHGYRVKVPAGIATANVSLALDISFGENIEAAEVVVPTLLDDQDFTLVGYQMVDVVAEKGETMMARGDANTRDRDWADILRLADTHPFVAKSLRDALVRTAASRGRTVLLLASVITSLGATRQQDWTRLLAKNNAQSLLPAEFADAITEVINFIDPVVSGLPDEATWDPVARSWS